MSKVSTAHAWSHLSEFIAGSVHGRKRFIINRCNRPASALAGINDLKIMEQHEKRAGLAEVAGKWSVFNYLAEPLSDIAELRRQDGSGLRP